MNFRAWFWRPVVAGFGTLTEVRDQWSIDDLADAHEVLDLQAQQQAQALARQQNSKGW